jgi:hypothetical protein
MEGELFREGTTEDSSVVQIYSVQMNNRERNL